MKQRFDDFDEKKEAVLATKKWEMCPAFSGSLSGHLASVGRFSLCENSFFYFSGPARYSQVHHYSCWEAVPDKRVRAWPVKYDAGAIISFHCSTHSG